MSRLAESTSTHTGRGLQGMQHRNALKLCSRMQRVGAWSEPEALYIRVNSCLQFASVLLHCLMDFDGVIWCCTVPGVGVFGCCADSNSTAGPGVRDRFVSLSRSLAVKAHLGSLGPLGPGFWYGAQTTFDHLVFGMVRL